jgi:hypothetical protein
MRALACIVLLLAATLAHAGDRPLYRYVDKNGGVHYTDRPPYKGAKPMVLYNLQTPTAKHKWEDAASAEIIRKAPRFAVQWTLPTPGQTYRETSPGIPVAVSVMPGLAKGFGLIFHVDGKAQNRAPLDDIQTTLHGIGAGKHELVAALISPEGKELVRSAAVSIQVKPALVKN